jgi:cytochrome c oxidase subunit II
MRPAKDRADAGRRRALVLGLAALATQITRAQADAEPRIIKLVAKKFVFTPERIEVKAGQRLLLELTSLDFGHGFNLPDLKLRTDFVPGIVVKLALQFDKPGDYVFVCDNYCGDGHEEMFGRFQVSA